MRRAVRSPTFWLAPVVGLVLALSLLSVPTAEAQEADADRPFRYGLASMRVQDLGNGNIGCSNSVPGSECSDFRINGLPRFTYKSNIYAIDDFYFNAAKNQLVMTVRGEDIGPGLPRGFVVGIYDTRHHPSCKASHLGCSGAAPKFFHVDHAHRDGNRLTWSYAGFDRWFPYPKFGDVATFLRFDIQPPLTGKLSYLWVYGGDDPDGDFSEWDPASPAAYGYRSYLPAGSTATHVKIRAKALHSSSSVEVGKITYNADGTKSVTLTELPPDQLSDAIPLRSDGSVSIQVTVTGRLGTTTYLLSVQGGAGRPVAAQLQDSPGIGGQSGGGPPDGPSRARRSLSEPPEPTPPDGIEPWDIQVTPGDGALTVTWRVNPRDGVEDSDIKHALRWSQETGVWANPVDPRSIGRNDGIIVEGGVTSYLITGLTNDVATGVFVRSFTGNGWLETDEGSSDWVRTKGEHTTPKAAQQQQAPPGITVTAATPLGVSEDGSGTYTVVLDREPTADVTVTATSSDDGAASVSPASHTFTASNWYEPATFTVSGVADDDTNDESVGVSHAVTSQDSGYENVLAPSVSVAVTDTTQDQGQQEEQDSGGGQQQQQQQTPTNNAPTVSASIADATIVNESGTTEVSLAGVFSDADNDALTVTASSSDTGKATVSVAADHSTLTVTAKARGTATVTVTASDGNGGTVADTFTVTVKAAPVVASAIADATMTVESVLDVSLSGVFSDADGDALTVTAASSDRSVAEAILFLGELTLLSVKEGSVTITVTAEDADGNRVSDAFDVAVTPTNSAPTVSAAIADATIVNVSGTKQVSLSGVFSDADGDSLTVTAQSSDTTTAAVSVSADHSTLTVTAKSRGTATVTVTADDGNGGTVADTFTVTVKAAPVVASAISDVSGLTEGTTQDVSLSGVFSDADGDALTITAASSDGAKATVAVASDGSKLTVTGVAAGTATLTVTAEDADGNRVSDAFDVAVVQAPEPEPEPEAKDYSALIAKVKEWRNDPQWVDHKEHTDRWDRVLLALGETVEDTTLTPMTAAEAQTYADKGWTRWVEVAEALKEIEGG